MFPKASDDGSRARIGATTASPDPVHVIHPDIDLRNPSQQGELRRHHVRVLGVIGAGGVAGAEARYGLGLLLPYPDGQFPWVTLIINASGCLLIGALMVLLLDLTSPHRLARPFLGVGVLGGYTTFSTFSIDAERLVRAHRPGTALLYVAATASACLAAVWLGTITTQLAGQAIIAARTRTVRRLRK